MVKEPTFGVVLKQLRLARGLTQKGLATRSMIGLRTIIDLEHGRSQPRLDTVQLIADGLELPEGERTRFVAAARGRQYAPQQAQDIPNNLPRDLPEFVGRTNDLAAVRSAVGDARLATLVGPGGIGKTRLAIEAARALLAEFSDGVWFVDLAPLRDPAFVASAIASVLGVRVSGSRSIEESLIAHLQERSLLLLLDNFEHVQAAAPLVTRLLGELPLLRVLITSRVHLRIPSGASLTVPPMRLPSRPNLSTTALAEHDAIALFISRARHARHGVPPAADTLHAVAEICRLLDGLPLAIELAAARYAVFSPSQLLDRLPRNPGLLSSRRKRATSRHQSLQAMLQWSVELLTSEARRLFQNLSVFAGGATLEAIEQLCRSDETVGISTVDALQELIEGNLVRISSNDRDEARYSMLETVRAYAWEQAEASPLVARRLRASHAAYYLAKLGAIDPGGAWFEQPDLVTFIERERDNLRATLRHLLDETVAEDSLRLANAMSRYWEFRGLWDEGRQGLEAALTIDSPTPIIERAWVYRRLGDLSALQSDYATARTALKSAIDIARSLGDVYQIALGLNSLGNALWPTGEIIDARTAFTESLQLWRALDDKRGIAAGLHNVGLMHLYDGDLTTAAGLIEQSIDLSRATQRLRSLPTCLMNLGEIAIHQGDFVQARTLLEESLALYRRSGEVLGIANCQYRLGMTALHAGEIDAAHALYLESLRLLEPLEDRSRIAAALEGVAACVAVRGQLTLAANLWGAAATMRQDAGTPLLPSNRADYDARTNAARATLGEPTWSTAWDEGHAWSSDQAVVAALNTTRSEIPPETLPHNQQDR